jgi:transposase
LSVGDDPEGFPAVLDGATLFLRLARQRLVGDDQLSSRPGGARVLLRAIRQTFPWLRHPFADGGYAGPKLKSALAKFGDWTLEIVIRSDRAEGFEIIPRRRVVERTFAWLGRCRRLAKDFEKTIASAEAWILTAHIRLVSRRIARYCYVA